MDSDSTQPPVPPNPVPPNPSPNRPGLVDRFNATRASGRRERINNRFERIRNAHTTTNDSREAFRNEYDRRTTGLRGGVKRYAGNKIKNVAFSALERQIAQKVEGIVNKLDQRIERGQIGTTFTIAILVAAGKDALDIFGTSIATFFLAGTLGIGAPAIVLYFIIDKIIDLCIQLFLFFFMRKKGWFNGTKVLGMKSIFWGLSLLDGIPYLDFFPTQTLTVYFAWRHVKARAENAEKEKQALLTKYTTHRKITQRELLRLQELSRYDDHQLVLDNRQ